LNRQKVIRVLQAGISALSLGTIIIFIPRIIAAFTLIAANRYMHHKMFRLMAFIFQKELGGKWIFLFSGAFIFLAIWQFILKKKLRPPEKAPQKILDNFALKGLRGIGGLAICGVLVLNAGLFVDGIANGPKGPNVVFVCFETLRSDHLGCYGYRRNTTPYIDRLAGESVVFERAYATSSWTLPSVHSMMTSLYQSSHGVIDENHRLAPSFITFAELMKNRGYQTSGFIAAPFLESFYGFNQGFDLYDESLSRSKHSLSHKSITSPGLTKSAISWLRKNQKRKFFLFLQYWDPHYDYIPPPPYDTQFDPDYSGDIDGTEIEGSQKINPRMNPRDLEHLVALYDGEIRWTDMHFGKIIEALRTMGLFEDTILVVVGDHGDEFLDHGGSTHKKTLYDEVIHVPLIIKIPGTQGSPRITTTVSTVDILPTVLELLKMKPPAGIDGTSLIGILQGQEARHPEHVYSELAPNLTASIGSQWKAIFNSDMNTFELFDMKNDPEERKNKSVAPDKGGKDEINNLKNRLRRRVPFNAPRIEKDEWLEKNLRSLGYIK
jgi:arylsulfatase A-like enzyme